jgi:hypothetical protein
MKALEARGVGNSEVVAQMIAAAIARPTPGVLCPDGKLYERGYTIPVLLGAGLITFSGAGNAPKYGTESADKLTP